MFEAIGIVVSILFGIFVTGYAVIYYFIAYAWNGTKMHWLAIPATIGSAIIYLAASQIHISIN
jgi:hypothetical protein